MADFRGSWDKIAVHYNKRYEISCDVVHYGPLCPGEDRLRLLGNINGKKVIDLGCGGGQNTLALTKLGAIVTGIDFSAEQINQAKRLAMENNAPIRFEQADIFSLPFIDDESYDVAISACAISFISEVSPVFAEAFRILRSRGRFIISDMNPLQYLLDETEKGVAFNAPLPRKSRAIDWTWEFDGLNRAPRFRNYVRPISGYVNSLVEAGFLIKKVLEPEPTLDTPHKRFSEEIMQEYPYIARHIPITFVIVCDKP